MRKNKAVYFVVGLRYALIFYYITISLIFVLTHLLPRASAGIVQVSMIETTEKDTLSQTRAGSQQTLYPHNPLNRELTNTHQRKQNFHPTHKSAKIPLADGQKC